MNSSLRHFISNISKQTNKQTARFAEYNQQDATLFPDLFISVRCTTCFRRFFRPSLGAENCTYSVKYQSDKSLTLYVQFWAPDDGRKNWLKRVQHLTEINKLRNIASCWLYSANISAMHGPMKVKQHGLACFIRYIQWNSSKMTSLRCFPPKTLEHLTCTSHLKIIFWPRSKKKVRDAMNSSPPF